MIFTIHHFEGKMEPVNSHEVVLLVKALLIHLRSYVVSET